MASAPLRGLPAPAPAREVWRTAQRVDAARSCIWAPHRPAAGGSLRHLPSPLAAVAADRDAGLSRSTACRAFRHINDAFIDMYETGPVSTPMVSRRLALGQGLPAVGSQPVAEQQVATSAAGVSMPPAPERSIGGKPAFGPDAGAVRMALRLLHMPPEKGAELSAAYVARKGSKKAPKFVRSVEAPPPVSQDAARSAEHLSPGLLLGVSEICPDDVCADPSFDNGGSSNGAHLPVAGTSNTSDDMRNVLHQINGTISEDSVDSSRGRV